MLALYQHPGAFWRQVPGPWASRLFNPPLDKPPSPPADFRSGASLKEIPLGRDEKLINIIRLLTTRGWRLLFSLAAAPAGEDRPTEPRGCPIRPAGTFRVIDLLRPGADRQAAGGRAMVLGGAAMETVWALGAGDKDHRPDPSGPTGRRPWLERPSIGSTLPPQPGVDLAAPAGRIIADSHFHTTSPSGSSPWACRLFSSTATSRPQVKGMVRALANCSSGTDRAELTL